MYLSVFPHLYENFLCLSPKGLLWAQNLSLSPRGREICMGPKGSGPVYPLGNLLPSSGCQCHWRVGSVRCGKEDGGAAVRIKVQDGVGACGLGAWYQLKLTETLLITWSWPVSRAPDVGGKLIPTSASTQSCPRRGPVPLRLLLMEPKELEVPLLVAQDHIGVAPTLLSHEFPLGQRPKSPQDWPGSQQDPAIPAKRRQLWKCLQAFTQPSA